MSVSAVYSTEEAAGDHMTTNGPGGFSFPTRYRIETADDDDFSDARVLVDRTDADQPNPGTESVFLDVDDEVGRYLRVTATKLYEFDPADPPGEGDLAKLNPQLVREERRPWQAFALGELIVRDADGSNLAEECHVSAASSVEEGAWGRAKLVDGVTGSEMIGESPLLRADIRWDASLYRLLA